jgi:Protein of unknown function (DUF3313)
MTKATPIIAPIIAFGLAVLLAAPVTAQAAAESWDGLVEVNARSIDTAFLAPGADFRPYTKVMLDEPEVAFRQNWMRDMNRSSRGLGGRVTEQDAARILDSVGAGTIDLFTNAFTNAGFEVVTRAGPDVLRISTAVVNLVVNAPDTMAAGRTTTFTSNAGEATLILEARDSQTNALIARIVDRRETRGFGGRTNRVTNTADFRALANDWARIAANRLTALKEMSPVPDPLTQGQRLP